MLKSFHHISLPGRDPRIAVWRFYAPDATATVIGHNQHKRRNSRLTARARVQKPTLAHVQFASSTWRTWHPSLKLPSVNNKLTIIDFRVAASGRRFESKSRATKKTCGHGNDTVDDDLEHGNSLDNHAENASSDPRKDATDSTCTAKQSETFKPKTDKDSTSVKSFKTVRTANRKETSGSGKQQAPDPSNNTQETKSSSKTETENTQHSIKSDDISIDDSSEQSDPFESSSSSTTTTTHETNSSQDHPTDELIQSQTMDWIHKVVIGYNLCPFAEKPIRLNIFTTIIVRGTDNDSILSAVLREMKSRIQRPGASLVVCPEYSPDNFETFMSLLNQLDKMPEMKEDLLTKLSAVPFHPLYEFEPQEEYGNDADSIENYVYRSPHPMILILRGTEVERALEKLEGDSSEVTYRNLMFLKGAEEDMGREKLVMAMRGEVVREMDIWMSYWKYIGYIDDPQKFK